MAKITIGLGMKSQRDAVEAALNDLGSLLALLVRKGLLSQAEVDAALAAGPDPAYVERVEASRR